MGKRLSRASQWAPSAATELMANVGREAVMFFDHSGRCSYISSTKAKVIGCEIENLEGLASLAAANIEDENALIDAEARLLARMSQSETITFSHQRSDNAEHLFHLEADLSVLRCAKSGRFEGIAIALRDVSDRALLQERLDTSRQEVLNAEREKCLHIVGSGRVIRERMSGVLGSAELLLESDLTAEQRGIAELLDKSARGLLPFLGDLLYFARLEAGEIEPEAQPTNIDALLRDSVAVLEGAARAKNIELALELEEGVPHQHVDGLRLRQILDHLLQSAIIRTANASVKLSSEALAGKIVISVAYDEPGAGAVDPVECFNPFADHTDTESALRLPIARRLALLLGGDLSLHATPSSGRFFRLALPRTDCAAPEQRGGDRYADRIEGGPCDHGQSLARILFICAEQERTDDPAETLRSCGFDVSIASSGDKAADVVIAALAAGHDFDLALIDGGGAPEFAFNSAGAIRAAGITAAQLPLLALGKGTGVSDLADASRSLVQETVNWPAEPARLIYTVMRWLPARIVAEDAAIGSEEIGEAWPIWRERALRSVETAFASGQTTKRLANELAGAMSRLAEAAAEHGDRDLEARAAALGRALRSNLGEEIQRTLARYLLKLA